MKIAMERYRSKKWLLEVAMGWFALIILGSVFGWAAFEWAMSWN